MDDGRRREPPGDETGDLLTGRSIGGYLLGAELGRGGMGVVYRAQSPDGTPAAVKVIAPSLIADEELRERFLREARAAARITHPNVVSVLAAGEDDGLLYLVMRCVDGEDVQTILDDGALPAGRAARIVMDAAAGVGEAHRCGIVHRDIKPANILVEHDDGAERAVVGDFGLAKSRESVASLSASGQLLGTVVYMAPEQFQGAPVDHRADIYALGCVLYHCLAGAPPYQGNDAAVMWTKLHQPLPRLADAAPAVASFDPIITRALASDPKRRYRSARAFADDVRRVGRGRTPRPAWWHWRPGRRFIAVTAALSIAIGGSALLIARGAASSGTAPPPSSAQPPVSKITPPYPVAYMHAPRIGGRERYAITEITPDASSRRITTLGDRSVYPAWSRDGAKLAFFRLQGRQRTWSHRVSGLYLSSATGADAHVVFDRTIWVSSTPAFSPDGSRVAFSYRNQPNGRSRLVTIRVAGGRAKVLAKATRPLAIGWPSWSPDGTRIAYADQPSAIIDLAQNASSQALLGNARSTPRGSGIYLISSTGGTPRRLKTGMSPNVHPTHPSWSPNGSLIAFTACPRGCHIYRVSPDGAGLGMIRRGAFTDPVWSPDGRWLAFLCSGQVCVSRADGTALRQITQIAPGGTAPLPAWIPIRSKRAAAGGATTTP